MGYLKEVSLAGFLAVCQQASRLKWKNYYTQVFTEIERSNRPLHVFIMRILFDYFPSQEAESAKFYLALFLDTFKPLPVITDYVRGYIYDLRCKSTVDFNRMLEQSGVYLETYDQEMFAEFVSTVEKYCCQVTNGPIIKQRIINSVLAVVALVMYQVDCDNINAEVNSVICSKKSVP